MCIGAAATVSDFLKSESAAAAMAPSAAAELPTEAAAPAAPGAAAGDPGVPLSPRPAAWSSGVAFYPPSRRFWRIGGKWYDFESFLDKHPGGSTVLLLARDRYEDCTFAFESHHLNYGRARAVIRQYEVPEEAVLAEGLLQRPRGADGPKRCADLHGDEDPGAKLRLLGHEAFYSVLRARAARHLRAAGHPDGGPTAQCVALFWAIYAAWAATWALAWLSGALVAAVAAGLLAAMVASYGHNWVHQPRYQWLAFISLEPLGFSSATWFREHVLQHHMYTNTPWDQHQLTLEPHLKTDPTVERTWLQRNVGPYINPVILALGPGGAYIIHLLEVLRGHEDFSLGKLLLPVHVVAFLVRWGLVRGLALLLLAQAALGIYYFSMGLMNHNAEHCLDIQARNASQDWGVAQINTCADWDVSCSFLAASRYLWLNYHTVHHLFPRVDFSHHPALQSILVRTCAEFGITYRPGNALELYKEMVHTFTTPMSLLQEAAVYAGGM